MADILENPVDLIDDAYEQEIQVEQEMIEVVAYRSYNRLDDKPQINGVELVGNKTSSDLGITAQIESAVNSEAQARAQADNTLQGKIDTEKLARQQADSTLQGNIDAEETARKAADKDIQDVLDGETLARQNADTALGGRIDTEIHDRQVADIALQGQIDAITSKSDVVDVVANYVALQAYDTSSLGNNDVIKVLDDETHEDALTYYRWSTTTQTWTYIGQEAPYYSKSQTDTLLIGKQNTIDSSHKLSADLVDDTSTTNKFVTASDITNWNGKQDALTAGAGIDITGGVISTPAIVPEVVTELPTTGTEGKLYLTPKAHTTQTATGNPITATVAEQAGKLESFQLDGDTFQQSYTGKNLLQITKIAAQTKNGVTFTSDGSSFVLDGTATASTDLYMHGASWGDTTEFVALPAGTYTLSVRKADMSLGANFSVKMYNTSGSGRRIFDFNANISGVSTTTLNDDSGFTVFYISIRSGVTFNNERFYVQLEKSSSVSDWEPFVGGTPSPSPEYPQQIQTVTGEQTVTVVGKNLFDKNNASLLLDGLYIGSTNMQSSNQTASLYIPCEPNTTYTVSKDSTARFACATTAELPANGVSVANRIGDNTAASITITTSSTAKYLVVFYYHSIYDTKSKQQILDSIQIEVGSQASSYAAYSKQAYPLDLGSLELCKLGTYQDYIWKDGEDWKVHKEIGYEKKIVSLAGIDGYSSVYGTATTSNGAFAIISTNWGSDYATTVGLAIASSVIGVYQSQNIDSNNIANSMIDGTFCQRSGTNDRVYFRFASWARSKTVDEVNQMVTDNGGIDLWYPLTTTTDTTITDQTLIAQLEAIHTASLENGTNTITNTATGTNLAGDMEIGYYGLNPTNRYDKFIWLDLNNNYEQIGGE